MGDYRSTSCANESMQMERYHEPRNASTNSHDFRSYSASYNASYPPTQFDGVKELKFKKGKSLSGSSSKSWNINDPEFQRKRRVASYKVYSVEGKVKGSFRKSYRWLKDRYSRVIYGWL